jgi:uncharacterized protein (TIGR04141 family)
MNRPKTRPATLYRFVPGVGESHEAMFDAFSQYVGLRSLDERHADVEFIEVAGVPAIWIGIQDEEKKAEWLGDAATTTGLDLSYSERRAGGLLLLGIDGTAYALSFGNGYLLIPDELKDERFGLSFLIRRLDSDQVQELVRRRANARGRTDTTMVAAGAPVWMLGVAENVEIIRRIGGRAKDLKVTFKAAGDRGVNVEGAGGLKMRFGVEPDALVSDIRECARVCREEQPEAALEFIEHIMPVGDASLTCVLDGELEKLLSGTAGAGDRLLPVVPTSMLEYFGQAHSLAIKIGYGRPVLVPSLELDDILRAARSQRDGERVKALRGGRIYLNADARGEDVLGGARADKWLEANISVDARRFFLMDGEWFEIGADYVRTSRDTITPLFPAVPSVTLLPWSLPQGRTENDYNRYVAARSGGRLLCLDRNQTVRDPLGIRSSLEICDLLGPDNELIHVKRAKGSAPLSHLFSQGLNSAHSLIAGPAVVRDQFAGSVASVSHGRVLPRDFKPAKVIYAILLENGKQLAPDTLFPFSQATLAHAARILNTYGIAVEVVGVPTAPLPVTVEIQLPPTSALSPTPQSPVSARC